LKILLDECAPRPLIAVLVEAIPGLTVDTVQKQGWGGKSDAEVLRLAEENGYDLFMTGDKNIGHQQNLTKLKIEIYPLSTSSWPRLQKEVGRIVSTVKALLSGREHLDENKVDE
jgi:predicted nuclease of predicted toxin-antitoxin system